MNALTTTVTDEHVDALVNELAGGLKFSGGAYSLVRLPTADETVKLQARQIALHQSMRSISYTVGDAKPKQLAGAAIAEMLHSFEAWKSKQLDANQQKEKQDSIGWYVHELRDMPLFAIEAACLDVRQARVPGLNPDWPPSSVRMIALARAHVEDRRKVHNVVKTLLTVNRVREPDITTNEKVAAVGEGLRKRADELGAEVIREEAERNEDLANKRLARDREVTLEEYRALGVTPRYASKGVLISPSLLRRVQEFKEQDAQAASRRPKDDHRDQGS